MASKTWLLTKEEHLEHTKAIFQDTQVNITAHGCPHLGVALDSKEYIDQFAADRVHLWVQDLCILSDIAKSQPHAAHAAITHGFAHKF